MSSPPPSQKGLAPHNESKVVLFIHCLGKLMDLSYLPGRLGDIEAFFAVNKPLGLGESTASAREWGNSSSILDNGTGGTAQFCTRGTCRMCQSWARSDSWAPHLWAVLGSADALARDTGLQNQLLPKFSVKWVCDCCDTYRQHREHRVLQSLTSEAITMSRDSVLGWGQTFFSA